MTYTNKTQPTKISPESFLKNFDEKVKSESNEFLKFYEKVTGSKCVMWNKIFGFGEYDYKDSTGGDHVYLATGFAIPKTGFTLYNIMGWEKYADELTKLGKFKISGKSCLSIKSIKDIDLKVLEKIIKTSLKDLKGKYVVRLK